MTMVVFVFYIGLYVCRLRNFVWACLSVCLSFHLSVSSYSMFCNCLLANFCTYLGDQLRWASAFLVASHYIVLLNSIYFVLHSWLNKLIDWLICRMCRYDLPTSRLSKVIVWQRYRETLITSGHVTKML